MFLSLCLTFFLFRFAHSSKCDDYDYKARHRFYCVGVKEVKWNYGPNSTQNAWDLTYLYPENAQVYLETTEESIGKVYTKALYKLYHYDESTKLCDWNTEIVPPIQNGLLGPTIRAVVGDTISVYFYNMGTQVYSFHPHGFTTSDYHEGFNYGSKAYAGGKVAPSEEFVYTWTVGESAGPQGSFSSIAWMYHSAHSLSVDINSGLIGFIIVASSSYISSETAYSGKPCDVDAEITTLLGVFDENKSWYISESAEEAEIVNQNDVFEKTNIKYTFNGYSFGNYHRRSGLSFPQNSNVRWHVGSGLSTGIETIAWNGNLVLKDGEEFSDFVQVAGLATMTVELQTHNVGEWLLSSNNIEAMESGMVGIYEVVESNEVDSNDQEVLPLGRGALYAFFVIVIIFSVLGVIFCLSKSHGVKMLFFDNVPMFVDDSQRSTHNKLNTDSQSSNTDQRNFDSFDSEPKVAPKNTRSVEI